MNTISHPHGAPHQTIPKDGVTMISLLQEEITDGLEVFKAWFEAEAIPQIEAAGGGCLAFGSLCKRPNDLGRRRDGDSSQRLAYLNACQRPTSWLRTRLPDTGTSQPMYVQRLGRVWPQR